MSFDVVIIGAGPAGFSAACSLASHGVQTLLCDAARIPVAKECGEAILPNGVLQLERLGISEEELRAVGQPLLGVRYFAPSGASAETEFAQGTGVALRRTELSKIMFRRAQKLDSLTIMDHAAVSIRREGAGFHVLTNSLHWAPRLVIAADGLNSKTRDVAGLGARGSVPERWSLGQHFRVESWTSHLEVYFGDGVQACVTPVAPDLVRITFLLETAALVRLRDDWTKNLLSSFPVLREKLAFAEPVEELNAIGPMQLAVSKIARDGLVLLGDAAGYVDALPGEGIGLAASQGAILSDVARSTHQARREGRVVSELELRSFARETRRLAEHNQELTHWLVHLSRHPKLIERAIDVFACEPKLFQHLLTASMGLVSPYAVPAAASVRAFTRFAVPHFTVPPQLGPHPSH